MGIKKIEFEHIETEFNKELSDKLCQKLNKMVRDNTAIGMDIRKAERELSKLREDKDVADALLREEVASIARQVGEKFSSENIDLTIKPKIKDLRLLRKSKGAKGISLGNPYDIHFDFIHLYEFYYWWLRSNLIVEFCYQWPKCNCKMYGSLHLSNFKNYSDAIEHITNEVSTLLGERIEEGEAKCPKCQVCAMDLDYKCEGFEDIKPLSEVSGRFVWSARRERSKEPLLEVDGDIQGKVKW
jgi:hypothetical protein